MSTIQENLQIIADSASAIKQAIIDKGGTISGDITTWANAISGIATGEGGSSSGEEYTFHGAISYNMTEVTITGRLNKVPDTGRNYLIMLGLFTGGLCYTHHYIGSSDSYTLTVDFQEPLSGEEIPAICILQIDGYTYTVIPVTFSNRPPLDTEPA